MMITVPVQARRLILVSEWRTLYSSGTHIRYICFCSDLLLSAMLGEWEHQCEIICMGISTDRSISLIQS
jgi:hypothetical protein